MLRDNRLVICCCVISKVRGKRGVITVMSTLDLLTLSTVVYTSKDGIFGGANCLIAAFYSKCYIHEVFNTYILKYKNLIEQIIECAK